MAMAMLLLGNGIERYQHLGEHFHEQVRLISQQLLEGASAEAHEQENMAKITALHCQMEEHEILAPLATEMQGNLQHIETSLNMFFSDASKRNELAPLRRLLAQVNGGFYLLKLDDASNLILPLQRALERYIEGATPASEEMGAVASAVSALENFVNDLSQGQKPDQTNLRNALQGLQIDVQQASVKSSAQEVVQPVGVAVREGGEDAELLEVFLEEAQEVLETMNANLEICQHNPQSRDALIIIRRGFHTLKGSGRMVGLTNLGEVAWAVEKALNKWLQDDKAISISLLELIGDAAILFEHWVDKLRSGGSALIDASALISAAQRIESGVEEVQTSVSAAVPAETEVEPEQDQEPELQDIVIGNITLSPILFNIATNEASSIIETLQRLVAQLRKGNEPNIGYDFVRAAHTLTGVNRSTGFTDISDLAAALEAWLQEQMDTAIAPDIMQLNLLEQTIAALSEMVDTLRNKQQPKARLDLIERLKIKKKQLSNIEPADEYISASSVSSFNLDEGSALNPVKVAVEFMYADQNVELGYNAQHTSPEQTGAMLADLEATIEDNGVLQEKLHPAEQDVDLVSYAGHLDQQQAAVPLPDLEESDESVPQYGDLESVDRDIDLVSYAEHIAQQQASMAPSVADNDKTIESHTDEIKLPDQELDLVAYVQRIAQEQAIEPLQWQSADEVLRAIADNVMPLQEQENSKAAQAKSENHFISFDMSELQAQAEIQTPTLQSPVAVPIAENFAINFEDLGFATETQAEISTSGEPALPFDPLQDIESAHANQGHDFITSLQLPDQQPQNIEPVLTGLASAINIDQPALAHASSIKEDALPPDASLNDKKRRIQDDLDDQLLPIFLEEADELYPQLAGELNTWRTNSSDHGEGLKIARKLQRSLHTLKGSARMAGAMRLGELTHRVEDCLDSAVAEGRQDAALLDELENYFDRIGSALEKLRSGDTAEEIAEPVAVAVSAKKNVVQRAADELVDSTEERKETAVLRVRSDIVDDLVNEAGEISVARSRMEVELNAVKGGLLDLSGSVQGLRKLVREIEMHAEGQMQARAAVAGESAEKFDPLEFDRFTRFQELTRFMSESVHDVQTVQQTLLKNLDETSAAMSAQAKLNSGLQQSLMSIRMLPFSSISQRLYRIVRQTGKELGKKVNLELYGTEIELDRGVLEKMTAPFEHLLRNAIVHGLENPDQRELKGKPPIGNIALSLRQEGNEILFEFRDDGAGLNTVKLRQKGIEQGLLKENEVVSDEKIMMLIFETGLSTASELTEISGRGVGMDVVRSEIKALGGRIEISSEADRGACFTIYLPLTLAVMKVLTVTAGNGIYAIPAVMVEQVQQLKPADLVELYQKGHALWQGKTYPLHYLPRLLGDCERTPDSKPYNTILLLRSGEQRLALHLDDLTGNKEVVVKNVGAQLSRLQGIAGATVQANGKVVLILNPVSLAQMASQTLMRGESVMVEPVQRVPVVMIVDDSLTVRKITTRLLTRVGYEVVTAKDGVDALEKLVDMMPDVMLLDVEMPRMDGFELTKQLRRDNKTKSLPIIMITSRTADKHRDYAREIGVNEYLGKPYQDDDLLEHIARYAPLSETAAA